jgi:hypothetical protein
MLGRLESVRKFDPGARRNIRLGCVLTNLELVVEVKGLCPRAA